MVRRKRPYVPKVKGETSTNNDIPVCLAENTWTCLADLVGCYECSQRRINCDQTRPGCCKCSSRGIVCSGFGVKFKFRQGLSRGSRTSKWQLASNDSTWTHTETAPALDSPPCQRFRNGSSASCEYTTGEQGDSVWDSLDESIFDLDVPLEFEDEGIFLNDGCEAILDLTLDTDESDQTASSTESQIECLSLLDGTSSWQEYLLDYFSRKIAPEMVVIDDTHNGWRHTVLPLARSNKMVMSAVTAAAAYHLSGSAGASHAAYDPSRLYEDAIRALRQRQQLTDQDADTQQAVILSIVVLLTAVMVNGCTDFPIMFQMLVSALDAIGGEAAFAAWGGEVAEFSLRQIRKMRVYAAPLLSPDSGRLEILCRAEESFECLQYYSRLHPQYADVFHLIISLRQQAYNIYLDQALRSCSSTPSTSEDEYVSGGGGSPGEGDSEPLIEQFTQTLESFPKDGPGEHVLVWSCYIAGSASRNPRHQAILEGFLERQYSRNGFANLLRAKEMLRYIWDKSDENHDWTAMLPESRVFIM